MNDNAGIEARVADRADKIAAANGAPLVIVVQDLIEGRASFDDCACIAGEEHGKVGVGETLPESGENGERENDVAESVRAHDEYSGRICQQKRSPLCNGCYQNIPVIPLNCNEGLLYPASRTMVPGEVIHPVVARETCRDIYRGGGRAAS